MLITASSPVLLSQLQANDSLVQDSIDQIAAIQEAWNQQWTDIFSSDSGLYIGINQFASIILVGTFIFFAVGWVKDAIERGIFIE